MKTLSQPGQRLLALALLVLFPLLIWAGVIYPLQHYYQSNAEQISSLEAQRLRYQQVNLSRDQLEQQQQQLQQWQQTSQAMLQGRTRPLRSADLQQALGQVLSESGAELVESKSLKAITQGELEASRLSARLRASLPQLLDTLSLLHESERQLSLDAMTIQARALRTIRGSERTVVSPLEVTLQLRGYAIPGESP